MAAPPTGSSPSSSRPSSSSGSSGSSPSPDAARGSGREADRTEGCRSASCSRRPSSAGRPPTCAGTRRGWRRWASRHLLAYDHVLGADPDVHQPWLGPYDVRTTFHEPFVLFGFLAGVHAARAGHRDHHPPAAPDRAGRQAGRRGRPAHRGSLPVRGRRGVEPRGVRGARRVVRHPRQAVRRADPAAAATVDRDRGDPRGRLRPGDRRRPRSPAVAATDPDLDRRPVAARLPPHRAAGRRLVPAGAPRPAARRGAGLHRRGRRGRRPGPRRPSAWRAA